MWTSKIISSFNVPNFQNKTIWGAGTHAAGYNCSPGLPNITGKTTIYSGFIEGGMPDGCFYVIGSKATGKMLDGGDPKEWIGFDASRSNSIYGNSSTVQPPALATYFIIKY